MRWRYFLVGLLCAFCFTLFFAKKGNANWGRASALHRFQALTRQPMYRRHGPTHHATHLPQHHQAAHHASGRPVWRSGPEVMFASFPTHPKPIAGRTGATPSAVAEKNLPAKTMKELAGAEKRREEAAVETAQEEVREKRGFLSRFRKGKHEEDEDEDDDDEDEDDGKKNSRARRLLGKAGAAAGAGAEFIGDTASSAGSIASSTMGRVKGVARDAAPQVAMMAMMNPQLAMQETKNFINLAKKAAKSVKERLRPPPDFPPDLPAGDEKGPSSEARRTAIEAA